ncbi:MAG: hypothetical protein ACFE78_13510 [Candidatus Hodarchaeota archaeon]
MENSNLIFSFSGIRGIAKKDFNFNIVKKLGIAFGLYLEAEDKRIIIGRDTRPSGEYIEKGVIEGLVAVGYEIIKVGICPSPVIIHAKNKLTIPAGIIITGSHNPQEWNGLKLLSGTSFLANIELEEIHQIMKKVNLENYTLITDESSDKITNINPIPDYINLLYENIDYENIKNQNKLRVVIDTGAGAGKYVTPQILEGLGCKVKVINNDLLINGVFPREIEPIGKNLKDLIMEVWQGKYDVGFAHDSDSDRLALIGENGICYPEDVGLAIITDYYLKNFNHNYGEIIFITNLASSLMFDVLAEKYNAKIIRTPIGEKFLVEKIENLRNEYEKTSKNCLILGGEGSCGGIMLPHFNNTRDGIFAAAKIIEILVHTGEKISNLTAQLPKYFSYRAVIEVKNKQIVAIIDGVRKELIDEGEKVMQINNDLRFGQNKEWFVLIHPSNTEPIIRVISEAKTESLARIYCEATAELVKLVLSQV